MTSMSRKPVVSFKTSLDHLAIVVSDIGQSVAFYAGIIGLKQIIRPDFDRHGAWLSMGNLSLHLIKGIPAVHDKDNLIVGHLAFMVEDLKVIQERLDDSGVSYRFNVSVPDAAYKNASVPQVFVQDPDGYYLEFCQCHDLEKDLERLTALEVDLSSLDSIPQLLVFTQRLVSKAREAKERVKARKMMVKMGQIGPNLDSPNAAKTMVDQPKLANLIKRTRVYGDVVQMAQDDEELNNLLQITGNDVPKVVEFLEMRALVQGRRTMVPPGIYEHNGEFHQPSKIELAA